jgi:hypothetical protein
VIKKNTKSKITNAPSRYARASLLEVTLGEAMRQFSIRPSLGRGYSN